MTSECDKARRSKPTLRIKQYGIDDEEHTIEWAMETPEYKQFVKLLADMVYNGMLRSRPYAVEVTCPRCGERHRLPENRYVRDGPTETMSLGDFCVGQKSVPRIVSVLDEKVWCEAEGEWVQPVDCNQVFLMP